MRHLIRIIIDIVAILWSIAMMAVAIIAAPAGAMFLGYVAVPYLRLDPLPPDMTWPWIAGGILALAGLYWTAGLVTAVAMKLIPEFKPRQSASETAKPQGHQVPPHRSGGGTADQPDGQPGEFDGPLPTPRDTPPGPPDHPGAPPQRVG